MRLTLKQVYVASGFLTLFIAGGLTLFFNFGDSREAYAAPNGSYRTNASGNWNSTAIWEKFNSGSWNAATSTPTSADREIEIRSGHTVTVTANVTVDELIVASGGTLILGTGTLTLNNGSGQDMDVNGVFEMGTNVITGAGSFTLNSENATLKMGSPDGIASSGSTGNIQITGARTFSSTSNYVYTGTSAQVTGSGLPAALNDLTINNTAGVTLSASVQVNSILYLLNGKLTTGSFEIYASDSTEGSVTGYSDSSYIIGNLRRSVSGSGTYNFPVGTPSYYELASITFSGATGVSYVLATFTNAYPVRASLPINSLVTNGTPLHYMLDYGYWTLTPDADMTAGTFTITLGVAGATNSGTDPLAYCVLHRTDSLSSWISAGTHNNSTQAIVSGTVTAARAGLSTLSNDFGIGGSNLGALPIRLVFFKATLTDNIVSLEWETSSEINNNFFTVERSEDGENFEAVFNKPGAGNSTENIYYSSSDGNPLNGYSYYRLKQTDFDGKYSYSDIETVKNREGETTEGAELSIKSVAPNPFSEEFKVSFIIMKSVPVDFILWSTTGQVIAQEKIQAEEGYNTYTFIDKYGLKKGIYFVNLAYNDQKITQKIVKE